MFVRVQRLSELYYDIHRSYLKVTEVVNSEKRLFGRYYRVAFYGQVSLRPWKPEFGSLCRIAVPTGAVANKSGHKNPERVGAGKATKAESDLLY